jgi:ribose transport system ATP-binding protein
MVNRALLKQKAERALERVGLQHMSPDTLAGSLGIGHQQLVELAAALEEKCKLLILDEPTAALTSRETETLFAHIDRLRSEGVCILYVSHRMDELRRIADRVSVLRDGERVATMRMADTSSPELVKLMAGREVAVTPKPRSKAAGKVLLEVSKLKVPPMVEEVSFSVKAGEILGLSGLVGAGRTETLRAIFGLERITAGTIQIAGVTKRPSTPAEATAAGLGLVPEDRKTQGLLLSQSIRINTTLVALEGAVIKPAEEIQQAQQIIQRLAVKCDGTEQPVSALSGGNQQKLVIGKWLLRGVQIFLLDEPTRGVDVPAKEAIYDLLRQLADEGKAVVVVSSELPELMSLCDRIVVLSAGRTVAEFLPSEWTAEKLTEAAFRGHLSST